MRQRAFTLIELLCVIVILAVLASLLFPVLGSALASSKRAASGQSLKQLYLALQLYRADNGETVEYGEATAMGLPNEAAIYFFSGTTAVTPNVNLWHSVCGTHASLAGQNTHTDLLYFPSDDSEGGPWSKYSTQYQGSGFLLIDTNCNSSDVNLYAGLERKWYVIATLNGSVRVKQSTFTINDLVFQPPF